MDMDMLRAGASETVITPPVGLPLLGVLQPSTGVHDDLFARALVLSDGERTVGLVCLDLVGLDLSLADELRAKVRGESGISTLLLNCSHTHSAPFTIPWSVQGWDQFQRDGANWRAALGVKISELVCRAQADMREVTLSAGRTPVQIGFNRRLVTNGSVTMAANPDGAVVPWVDVLRVDDADGNPIAIVFSHAAHPVIVHASSTLISADYPGCAAATVRQHFGEGVVAMFAPGCTGNINADPLRGGFGEAERAGNRLGNAVIQAANESHPISDAGLLARSVTLNLPLQRLPKPAECNDALREAKRQLDEAEHDEATDETQLWYLQDNVLALRAMLRKAERHEHQRLKFEIHALSFGQDSCLLALPHEVFAEYQLWAEQVSPFRRTMVWGYTNGCESYVPTEAALSEGGYEAAAFPDVGAALRYPYRVALQPSVEGQIKEAVGNLLN